MTEKLRENSSQQEAINTIDGPVIIVSCPGSGKTTTLIRRIHHMVESGVDPRTILMVTFAKAAADDMAARYKSMYNENPGISFATIHKFCYLVLLKEGVCTRDSLLDEREKREIIRQKLQNYADINDIQEMITSVITELSVVKNNYVDLETYTPQSCDRRVFMSVYKGYEQEKSEMGKIDFDDMLLQCLQLFKEREWTLNKYKRHFKYIQCDEYQDTNCIQRDILYLLAGDTANLCVVGDDDQSIYRFRGADSSIMMGFMKDFEGHDPKKIVMDRNYRSAQKIIDVSGVLIEDNKTRFEKKFISNRGEVDGIQGDFKYVSYPSKSDEVESVVKEIKRLHEKGMPYKDMAILFRNNKQAAIPAQILSREKIPFNSSERIKTLYDEWMFEDIKAYVSLSMGKDIRKNLLHVLNRPNRYLKAAAFIDRTSETGVVEYNTTSMLKAISYLESKQDWQYDAARESIFNWLNAFGPGKVTMDTPTAVLFEKLVGRGGIKYSKHIKQSAKFNNQDEQDNMEDFNELKNDALKYKTIGEWFRHAAYVSRMVREESRKKEEQDCVALSTMHRSKGQEWKAVFLIGVNEGIVPSKNAITREDLEEERRVLYVGMTRAKDDLQVSYYGKESPFMKKTMAKLKEKYEPTVKKKLAGSPVMHDKLGKGKIVSYTADKVTVRMDNGNLEKFKFPESFQKGHLKYI